MDMEREQLKKLIVIKSDKLSSSALRGLSAVQLENSRNRKLSDSLEKLALNPIKCYALNQNELCK